MSYDNESDDEDNTTEMASRTSLQDELIKIIQAKGLAISLEEVDEIAVSMATRYSGPIPPPEQLGEYERILPGCADRIIRAFENQQMHRIQLADRTNKSQLHQANIGQIMGGLMVLSCMGITGWMGFLNHTVLAGTIGTTTVVSLATIYFLGRKPQNAMNKGTAKS